MWEYTVLEITAHPALLILIGFIAGCLAALFGIGGGILVTPGLDLLGAPLALAVPTSINFVAGTAIMTNLRNRKAKAIRLKPGLITAAFMLPCVEISARLMKYLMSLESAAVDLGIRVGFIVFLLLALLAVARTDDKMEPGFFGRIRLWPCIDLGDGHKFSLWVLIGGAFVAGISSGLFGLGGGRVLVPLFLVVLALPTKVAVGTSSFVILVAGIFGAITYGLKGMVDYPAVGCLLFGSLIGAYLGTAALQALAPRRIRHWYVALSAASLLALLLKQAGQDVPAMVVLGGTSLLLVCWALILTALGGETPDAPAEPTDAPDENAEVA